MKSRMRISESHLLQKKRSKEGMKIRGEGGQAVIQGLFKGDFFAKICDVHRKTSPTGPKAMFYGLSMICGRYKLLKAENFRLISRNLFTKYRISLNNVLP